MEIDWGGQFNYTSCGCPMTNWQGHETHCTGHNTSEVDWGGHDPNPNHVNESFLSEVDWGAHDSSVVLFLVNIDYDAKPNESSIQGLWGKIQHRTSSIPLIWIQTDSLATGNRSLTLWTLLAVLWQMCHIWITYGTVRSSTITMRKSSGE